MIYRSFRRFAEEHLPRISDKYSSLVIAHPHSGKSLSHCLSKNNGKVLYAVGPEGGWVDFEVEKFKDTGMNAFTIGSRILKVDTAVVSIHGRISQLLG